MTTCNEYETAVIKLEELKDMAARFAKEFCRFADENCINIEVGSNKSMNAEQFAEYLVSDVLIEALYETASEWVKHSEGITGYDEYSEHSTMHKGAGGSL